LLVDQELVEDHEDKRREDHYTHCPEVCSMPVMAEEPFLELVVRNRKQDESLEESDNRPEIENVLVEAEIPLACKVHAWDELSELGAVVFRNRIDVNLTYGILTHRERSENHIEEGQEQVWENCLH